MRMRQGDFSECDPSSPNANQIVISQGCVVPTVNGLPTDTIPSINPNAAALLNGFIPLPNNGIDGYRKAPSIPINFREEQIRVDQNLSDKASLFVRVTNDTNGLNQRTCPVVELLLRHGVDQSQYSLPRRRAALDL